MFYAEPHLLFCKVWVVIQSDITSARRVLFSISKALFWSDLKHLGARLFILRSSREIYPSYWVLINVAKVKASLSARKPVIENIRQI